MPDALTATRKARPILFSGPMVRAILDGRKTQTRRVVKGQALMLLEAGFTPAFVAHPENSAFCPYGQPGDLLYVREAHYLTDDGHDEFAVYAADNDAAAEHLRSIDRLPSTISDEIRARHKKLRPSSRMPRWASRITLLIEDIRVQRVQEIKNEGCICEGVPVHPNELAPRVGPVILGDGFISHYGYRFRRLWDSINAKRGYGWDANPWVWAVTFKPIAKNVDEVGDG